MRIPKSPPAFKEMMEQVANEPNGYMALLEKEIQDFVRRSNDRYLHWDKVRFQALPKSVTPEQAWAAIYFSRMSQLGPLPISFQNNQQLRYWIPPQQHEWLSFIDQRAGGNLGTHSKQSFPDDNERYLFNSLMLYHAACVGISAFLSQLRWVTS